MTTTAEAPSVAPAPQTPPTPTSRRWTAPRVIAWLGVAVPSLFILFVMSGTIASIEAVPGFPFISIDLQFPALLVANTPTGGDMGSHVLLPQVLRDVLLPQGRIMGWSEAWYAGFPALYFYFPIPALTTVLLDVVMPYGVAFKLTTIVGLVALPAAGYFFARSMGFSKVVAAIAGATASTYVFMESFSIFGANIKSTLAGEFSFSWSFALSLVYLGIVTRNTREGRRFSPAAGIVLALTALTHIVTTIVVVFASLPLLLRRNGPKVLTSSWTLGLALSAFWSIPLLVRVLFQGMHTDMGWAPVETILGDTSPGSPFPDEFIPIVALGILGLAWTLLRRFDVVTLVWLTVLPLAGYFILPLLGITALYNARLLPYWYYGMFLFAGLAIGLAVVEASRLFPQRGQNVIIGTVLVAMLVLNATLATIRDVPGWVRWNYSGYEGKEGYDEYAGLMEAIDQLPPGRVMWEANNDMNKYGTPMALMLIPYWSPEHPSMEGLFFESSLTTPFHFLNASEVSSRPSNPVRGLRYRGLDFDRGIAHLKTYNVRYYVSYTDTARDLARSAGLTELAVAPPWTIFELPPSSLVDVASFTPAVYTGEEEFLQPALEWYDDYQTMDHWLVAEGPDNWPTVSDTAGPFDVGRPIATSGTVSDIELRDGRLSFTTTAVGVPHLVKISYFPNWEAEGADGPYRAAPSLMVVVPTQEHVVLEFHDQGAERFGQAMTAGGLLVIGWYVWRKRRERIEVEAAA